MSLTCEFVNWNNPMPVTATLVPFDGGLVLVERKIEPYIGYWCLPGGFIESCEQPDASAAREVFEETGLVIHEPKLLAAEGPGRNINVIILFYEAKYATGTMLAGDDASDVRTYKATELPKNIAFDLHRKMIRQWFEVHEGVSVALT